MSQDDGTSWVTFVPMLDMFTNPYMHDATKQIQIEELSPIVEALIHFETLRQRPALLYMAEDNVPYLKNINDSDVLIIYDMLRHVGPIEHLDLIINTPGGNVTAVRKLLHLLHTLVSHLTVFVPYKAYSAGTLLCLGANEIVMTPLAALGPIDPRLEGMQGGKPGMFSSEDITAFRSMAHDWFGVRSEDDAITLLRLFCDSVSPPSLARFFRAEHLVRQIALEAVRYQLPDADDKHRHIVEQLMTGYHDHQYPLNSTDLINLGLRITAPSPEEECLLWSIWANSRQYLDTLQLPSGKAHANGLLLSSQFFARHRIQISAPGQQREEAASRFFHNPHWEVLQMNSST